MPPGQSIVKSYRFATRLNSFASRPKAEWPGLVGKADDDADGRARRHR